MKCPVPAQGFFMRISIEYKQLAAFPLGEVLVKLMFDKRCGRINTAFFGYQHIINRRTLL